MGANIQTATLRKRDWRKGRVVGLLTKKEIVNSSLFFLLYIDSTRSTCLEGVCKGQNNKLTNRDVILIVTWNMD